MYCYIADETYSIQSCQFFKISMGNFAFHNILQNLKFAAFVSDAQLVNYSTIF